MKIVALAGGVGGARLAHGLAQILPPDDLSVIVNTGDDFEHLGLSISPDLDTVCYTLAGMEDPQNGWGRAGDTFKTMAALEVLGGPTWFRIGDLDFATHLQRTKMLLEGATLSNVTRAFCAAWRIPQRIFPMTDSRVRTIVDSDEGELAFQDYFVRRRCEPKIKGFRFAGIDSACAADDARAALASADAVIICPSNPWVSIAPILRVLGAIDCPMIAVSPIIGGKAVKGPAAKMFVELGIAPSAKAVAVHYHGLLAGFVLDTVDNHLATSIDVRCLIVDTLMRDAAGRARLAQDVLAFVRSL